MDEIDDQRAVPMLGTGIPGLDAILKGGFPAGQLYLIEGVPGSGKTTLALQFLRDGAERGEKVLYVTLSESRSELLMTARSHGWDLAGIDIHEMDTFDKSLSPDQQLTYFHPSELELSETIERVLGKAEELLPSRVVLDSLSEIFLLAQSSLRYRRQVLALKQFFAARGTTVLFLDDRASQEEDVQLQSLAHGVVRLDHMATEYGAERRQIRVIKMRGVAFRSGLHDYVIREGGLQVFPRLAAAEHVLHHNFPETEVSSGLASLDQLLGGGVAEGSSTLFMGPAGSGKSSVAMKFCVHAASLGRRSALFLFDETEAMLRTRARKLGMALEPHLESGLITLKQIEPTELSSGEFAAIVRAAVDGTDGGIQPAKVVLIDSLNGYLSSMSQEKQLVAQLHELFKFTNQQGVVTLVTLAQSGLAGMGMLSPVDATYLSDNVILFRYFETFGRIRRAISVIKKRSGGHELTLRELTMGPDGIGISEPLENFQGILTGVPSLFSSPPAPREGA